MLYCHSSWDVDGGFGAVNAPENSNAQRDIPFGHCQSAPTELPDRSRGNIQRHDERSCAESSDRSGKQEELTVFGDRIAGLLKDASCVLQKVRNELTVLLTAPRLGTNRSEVVETHPITVSDANPLRVRHSTSPR
jgi:hypothetical protein